VSEGGFEPPRPIRPLGPQPRPAHGGGSRRVCFGALTCLDTTDLVRFMVAGGTGCTGSWGNGWGNAVLRARCHLGVRPNAARFALRILSRSLLNRRRSHQLSSWVRSSVRRRISFSWSASCSPKSR
jgi:hypothetical protein